MELGIAGKAVLVTAASRGLGRAIAQEFAREGAHVAVSARNLDQIKEFARELMGTGQARVAAIAADSTSDESVCRLVDEVERQLGPIEVLVNNSPGPESREFARMTDQEWRTAIDLKLLAQIRHARAIFPRMVGNGGGRIVNIVGTHGLFAHAYAMTAGVVNAALLNLTKALAEAGAPANVLVNALNPGPIDTDRMRYLIEVKAQEMKVPVTEAKALLASETLLKRFGTPEEIAGAVVFLASARASYITGAILNVDGGQIRTI